MSIARINPAITPIRAARQLRSVSVAPRGVAKSTSRKSLGRTVLVGIGALLGAQLLLNIGLSTSVYELSHLKQERASVGTEAQIIGQQVDSLASQQNLADSAASMGMIANANPVFLRIADAKVFGKPRAAIDSAGRVAKNNLANSAMTDSSALALKRATAAETKNSAAYVAPTTAKTPKVAFSGGVIPAPTTH